MIAAMREAVRQLGGLTIERATFEDPVLSLGGTGWSLNCVSAWRLIDRSGTLVVGWSDSRAPSVVAQLVGQRIVDLDRQGVLSEFDPALSLSGGDVLEVFADHPVDPWVLRLPDMIFVGSPSEPA